MNKKKTIIVLLVIAVQLAISHIAYVTHFKGNFILLPFLLLTMAITCFWNLFWNLMDYSWRDK